VALASHEPGPGPAFLAAPRLRPLATSEGLRRLLAVRPRHGGRPRQPGAEFMALARLFSSARFVELGPGGTPAETAAMLVPALD